MSAGGQIRQISGVRPEWWTVSGGGFDRLPGVAIRRLRHGSASCVEEAYDSVATQSGHATLSDYIAGETVLIFLSSSSRRA